MTYQPEPDWGEATAKQAVAPLREEIDRAVMRLGKEFDALVERIAPALAPDVPHDMAQTANLYRSPLGQQVAAIHEIANRIANIAGRVEL